MVDDELSRLPFVIALVRQATRTIRQNLWIRLGMVAVLVPATLFGLPRGAAVVFHEGSTLLVVANALRLLAYREPGPPASPPVDLQEKEAVLEFIDMAQQECGW